MRNSECGVRNQNRIQLLPLRNPQSALRILPTPKTPSTPTSPASASPAKPSATPCSPPPASSPPSAADPASCPRCRQSCSARSSKINGPPASANPTTTNAASTSSLAAISASPSSKPSTVPTATPPAPSAPAPPPLPQSLLLFNSELSLLAAQHLAGRIVGQAASLPLSDQTTKNQIEQLYLLTISRRPTAQETATLEKFLTRQSQRLTAESRPHAALALPIPYPGSADPHTAAALVDACLAILNSNEFIYFD
jgi:hypothetical protein